MKRKEVIEAINKLGCIAVNCKGKAIARCFNSNKKKELNIRLVLLGIAAGCAYSEDLLTGGSCAEMDTDEALARLISGAVEAYLKDDE